MAKDKLENPLRPRYTGGTYNSNVDSNYGHGLFTQKTGHVAIISGYFVLANDVAAGTEIGDIGTTLLDSSFFTTCGSNGSQYITRGQVNRQGKLILEAATQAAGGYYSFSCVNLT